MSTVLFYISGHGFGHASRDIEVINALGRAVERERAPRIVIRTDAARWLFDLTVRTPFAFEAARTDTGVVQHDSLTHDVDQTLRRAAAFYSTFEERVAREAEWLNGLRRGAEDLVVVGDIPPLAFAAAARAGVPAAALGNFTWDWIYEDYVSDGSRREGWIVKVIAEAYSLAPEAWRLPMHGGFESIGGLADVPFIARHSRRDPEETRRAFGLPLDRRIVLSSFGGYGLRGLALERVDGLGDFAVVAAEATARSTQPAAHVSPHVFTLDDDAIYAAGFRYEDLVRAADVVITKPGFGIIAECLANDTALVYTSRGRFREYPVLVAEMPHFLRCAYIEQNDLFAGRWRAAIERSLSMPEPPTRPATDGAEVVAEKILKVNQGSR